MSKKTGINVTDQKKVARYFEQGYSAQEIGEMLYIKTEVVERFKPVVQEEVKKKTKARNKKVTEEHDEIMTGKKKGAKAPQGKPTSE